jgi:Protein of unknown function (DUF3631)
MIDASTPDPLDGADLLDRVREVVTRYVILPSVAATTAIVLWIAATHGQRAWQFAPRVTIKSPVKRCGKSRLLDIIEATCHAPLVTFNATVAAVVRSIRPDDPPTLLVDEADAIWSKAKGNDGAEDIRALLNAGFQRGRPVIRCVGPRQIPTKFPSFAMCALAGIGDTIPDTITDRSIIVRMRRRAPGEVVSSFRLRRDTAPLHALREELSGWIAEHIDALADAQPAMPVEDRAADTWEPLIAVADLAGGEWPFMARRACEQLTKEADQDDQDTSLTLLLLGHVREVFRDEPALHSATIVERLHAIEAAPWADFFGKPFTARDLSLRLKHYSLKADQLKLDGRNRNGFTREQLNEVWDRYLPPPPTGGGFSTSSTWPTGQVGAVEEQPKVEDLLLPAPFALPRDQASSQSRPGRAPTVRCPVCGSELTAEQAAMSMLCSTCLGRARAAEAYIRVRSHYARAQRVCAGITRVFAGADQRAVARHAPGRPCEYVNPSWPHRDGLKRTQGERGGLCRCRWRRIIPVPIDVPPPDASPGGSCGTRAWRTELTCGVPARGSACETTGRRSRRAPCPAICTPLGREGCAA